MTAAGSTQEGRAHHVAALGFIIQLAAFATLAGISVGSNSAAAGVVARLMVAGLPIWAVLFFIFKQLRRVRAEQLETVELQRARDAGGSSAIFDLEDEELLLERNRLRWMVRWFLPSTTLLVAGIFLLGHFFFWSWSPEAAFKTAETGGLPRTENPTLMMWFVVGAGFVCFLYARYVLALSRIPEWRLLHAGAVFIAGSAIACLGLSVSLMATTSVAWAEPLLAYVLRWSLIVLGFELLVNFVLDFYRPRLPGIVARPSFDSQFLGLVTEPGSLAKSIAQAANYQFGFEVSSTWFYQLLQRWMLPILVVTGFVVIALTSVVVVDADEHAVIERFGRPIGESNAILDAGLHLKWPFPVDVVHRVPAKRLTEMVVGEATQKDDDPHRAILWTEAHDYVPELMLLVAASKSDGSAKQDAAGALDATRSVAASLLMVSVPIEYRIRDIRRFLYTFADPEKVLEGVAYRYLTDFAARVDLDTLMGPGRTSFNEELRQRIQERVDDLQLGIEIAFVGVRGAHPPAKDNVAQTFQGAIAAQTNMQATVKAAEGEARRILTAVAGSEARARTLDETIRHRDRLQSEPNPDTKALAEARTQVEKLLMGDPSEGVAPLSGEASSVISRARGDAAERIGAAATKVRAFSTEIAAFEAAPILYRQRKVLETYAQLSDIRKYLILGDHEEVIIEYITSEQGGLDRVLSEGIDKEKRKQGP